MAKALATVKRRRQHGTGAVYQRASDGLWIGSFDAGWTKNGTRRRPTVSAKTEALCKAKLKKKMAEVEAEGLSDTDGRVTVKAWAETWLPITVHELRPKTYLNNRTAVTRWIIPTIGHKRLDTLTPGDVRAVANAIRKADLSSTTALRAHSVLLTMLKAAILEGHRVPQRILLVNPPSKEVNDRDAMPLPDALAMLRIERIDRSRWAAAFLQGMRQGECLGLTWACVDFITQTIDVSWQLQALNYQHGCLTAPCGKPTAKACPSKRLRVPDGYECRQLDGTLCIVRPKTNSGQRIIPLVPWMAAALAEWRQVAPHSPHGLVWPRPDGRPQRDDLDREAWYELQDAAQVANTDGTEGRRYALHEARHTTATMLLEAGTDPKTVEAIMGHASIVTSRLYQHASQELTRKALEGLAERLQLT